MKIGLKPLLSVVLLIVILIPAGVVIVTGLSTSSAQSTHLKTDEVIALGYAQSAGFDVLLDECVASLVALAQFEEVRQTAVGNYNAVRDEVTGLFESFMNETANPHLLNIIIMDTGGTERMDAFGSAGDRFFASALVENLGRNETIISDINLDNNTFFVLTSVSDEDAVIGFICKVYSIELFTSCLNVRGFFEGEGNLFITDRNGNALGLDGVPVTRDTQIASAPLRELINDTIQSARDSEMREFRSNTYVGAYGTINGNKNAVNSGWFWFATYPRAAIDTVPSPVIIAMVVVIGLSLIFIFAAFILVRKVTAPPHDMIIKMRKINEGDMDERLTVTGKDEYSYISESFNEMLDEILISGKMHRTISELSDNMLFEWDFKKQTLFVSDNFLEMFEVDTKGATLLNGRFIDGLMEKEEAERYKIDLDKLLRNHDSMHGEYQIITKAGSVIWVSVRAHCVLDRLNELLRIVGVITNINSEKLLSLQLSERASYDFLSGLYNRNTFMRELQSEITRTATSRVGVIFIDVDDFKFINDTYGHDTGDEIIKTVANIIKEKLGSAGFAGRFGGDEFVMCVTEEETLNNIGKLATGVLELFDKGYRAEKFDVTLKIKASLGVAISPEHGRSNETLLAAADEAMYFVKKNGKCNYHIYNPEESVITELMTSI